MTATTPVVFCKRCGHTEAEGARFSWYINRAGQRVRERTTCLDCRADIKRRRRAGDTTTGVDLNEWQPTPTHYRALWERMALADEARARHVADTDHYLALRYLALRYLALRYLDRAANWRGLIRETFGPQHAS